MPFSFEDPTGILTGGLVYGGLVLAAFWLAMIVWTFRDMRARSRDRLGQLLVALMVAILTVPGLIIYLFLRPRETLSEAYERSLEEEALLQEIEEKPICPGCKARVQHDWQACPHCHTRLKKPCARCGKMLDLAWDVCPYCTATTTPYSAADRGSTGGMARPALSESTMADAQAKPRARSRRTSEALEFIDGDDSTNG
jgi:RNA polymerase subunit RPABC4/transcription elongation factor Spt4